MNPLALLPGLEGWKPLLTALALPPVPLLLLVLAGAGLLRTRRGWGWALVALGVAGLWLGTTAAAGRGLERLLLRVPPALTTARIEALRRDPLSRTRVAVVVLGGGVERLAPEYGLPSLRDAALQRLRYGVWLGRATGLPVAFTGGTGWGDGGDAREADAAARIAAREFGAPLRWTENRARDTRENATHLLPLLRRDGVTHVLLVTHGWHLPRAQRHFEAVAAGAGVRIEPAPMGLARGTQRPVLDWLPSGDGFTHVRQVLREALAGAVGA